jgi:hypothetical protein
MLHLSGTRKDHNGHTVARLEEVVDFLPMLEVLRAVVGKHLLEHGKWHEKAESHKG